MKQRRIYYRKKGKSIVIEGRNSKGKSILIWTLPDAETLTRQLVLNASFFATEKSQKIWQKYLRLAFKEDMKRSSRSKLPLIIIKRTQKLDAIKNISDVEKKILLEMSK